MLGYGGIEWLNCLLSFTADHHLYIYRTRNVRLGLWNTQMPLFGMSNHLEDFLLIRAMRGSQIRYGVEIDRVRHTGLCN